MENRHVKFEYEDALNGKKQLLSSEINLLHILKKIKSYKLLRKKELILKNKLRLQLGNLRKKLIILHNHLLTTIQAY